MRVTLVVLAIVATVSCASLTGPTAPGLVWRNATALEIQRGEQIWQETAACAGVDPALLSAVEVTVVQGGFMCGPVLAAGCTYLAPVSITVASQWLETALPHEFLNAAWKLTHHVFRATPENPYADDWRLVNGGAWAKCDPNAS